MSKFAFLHKNFNGDIDESFEKDFETSKEANAYCFTLDDDEPTPGAWGYKEKEA